MFPRKLGVVCLGVICIFALLGGAFGLMAAVADGVYYYNIHTKMIECNEFVKVHLKAQGRFPYRATMDDWSQKHGVFPGFSLGAPGADESFDLLEGRWGSGDYRIAYWDGDRHEFFNSWDQSFTTSTAKHSGTALLIGITSFALGALTWRMRQRVAATVQRE